MSDTDFACTFEMTGNIEIEPPTDADNQGNLQLVAKAFNEFMAQLLYADSYAVHKNPDHSCSIHWTERTIGPVSIPTGRLIVLNIPLEQTISACW